MHELEKENAELKEVLGQFLEAIILSERDGTGHVDNDLIKRAFTLCGIDPRVISYREEKDDD